MVGFLPCPALTCLPHHSRAARPRQLLLTAGLPHKGLQRLQRGDGGAPLAARQLQPHAEQLHQRGETAGLPALCTVPSGQGRTGQGED